MTVYKWKLDKNFLDSILIDVNSSFFGHITDNMLSAYFGQDIDKYSIDLIVLFKIKPSKLDNYLVKNEIIYLLEEDLYKYGIRKINFVGLYGEDIYKKINIYKDYFTIFKKYTKNIDDSIEAEKGNG